MTQKHVTRFGIPQYGAKACHLFSCLCHAFASSWNKMACFGAIVFYLREVFSSWSKMAYFVSGFVSSWNNCDKFLEVVLLERSECANCDTFQLRQLWQVHLETIVTIFQKSNTSLNLVIAAPRIPAASESGPGSAPTRGLAIVKNMFTRERYRVYYRTFVMDAVFCCLFCWFSDFGFWFLIVCF